MRQELDGTKQQLWLCLRRHRRLCTYLITVGLLWHTMNKDLDISVKHRQPSTSGLKTVTTKHLQMSSDETYWRNFNSRSSSSTQQLPKGIRIAFRLRDTGEFGVRTDEPCYKYPDDIQRGRERTMDLPPTLTDVRSECLWKKQQKQIQTSPPLCTTQDTRGGRYLDFSTSVSTNLKILFLGDSVAEQFGKAFNSAATGIPDDVAMMYAKEQLFSNETNLTASSLAAEKELPNNPRVIFKKFMGNRMCLFASTPVRGGGSVALWRVVKLFSMSRRGLGTCNNRAGGWNEGQLSTLLGHEFRIPTPTNQTTAAANDATSKIKIGKFDAVILRIQLGWMSPSQITQEALHETISLCRDYIGARTVVVMTINFTNDVHNPREWAWVSSTNSMMREMASEFNKNATDSHSDFRVQIMEFANFTTQVHWANTLTIHSADGVNYEFPDVHPPNASSPNYDQEAHFLFDRFKPWHAQNSHPHSIPTVCARMKDNFLDNRTGTFGGIRRACVYNAIMEDGLHWCMSSVGPRYHAGLSCLLGCAYNREAGSEENIDATIKKDLNGEMEHCEKTCNEQFMSLIPIDESWLEKETTIYSVVPE